MADTDLDLELGEILASLDSETPPREAPASVLTDDGDETPPEIPEEAPAPSPPTPQRQLSRGFDDDDDDGGEPMDPDAIMDSMGTTVEPQITDIFKAWMHYHEFVVVDSIEQLEEIITQAFKTGKCSLDLETQGLDNRIYKKDPNTLRDPYEEYWDGPKPSRILQTVHKIVGYCLSPDGHTGYYVPVRHTGEGAEKNLDVVAVGKLIKKLCLAAQPVIKPEGLAVDPLASALIDQPKIKLFFWHAKFDQEFLLPVTGIDYWHPESFEDAMLVYYCIYSGDKSLGLKDKSLKKLQVKRNGNLVLGHIKQDPKNPKHELVEESSTGLPIPYEMIELKELFYRGRPIDFGALDPEEARYYACSDAICTYLHCDDEVIKLAIRSPKFASTYRLEKQVAQVLRWMERNRIKIDHEYVRKLFVDARIEADEYRKQIVALAEQKGFRNFDPQSTQQLSDFLFASPNGLNIEPKPEKTKNELRNQYKTDADTLEKLVEDYPDINPILLTIVKFRQVEKVLGTYLEGLLNNCDENSELRYQFKQTGAPTGRFTAPAGDPAHGYGGVPIHGIPSTYDENKPKVATALRKAFVARAGYTMVKVDFAGEELRIVTNLSGEPVWIKEFNEGTGDLHTITAKTFFGDKITKQQRQMGKAANFSLVFGGGVQAIMRATQCTQLEAARRKANFDKAMPVYNEWVKGQKIKVKRDKGVYSAFKRWMLIPDVDSPDKKVVAACERCSLNYPIQACLQASSRVLTATGHTRIDELVEKTFKVWTGTKWALATAKCMGSHQLAEITLSDGTTIRCDTKHKQLGVTSEGYNWVEFQDLRVGTRVATSLCQPVEFPGRKFPKVVARSYRSKITPHIKDEEAFWYWMGVYLGDGWFNKERGVLNYIFGWHEYSSVRNCLKFWKSCGLNPKVRRLYKKKRDGTPSKVVYNVGVWSVDLVDLLLQLGFSKAVASTKRLPTRILQETLTNRKAFIRGVMDSDGHKPPLVSAKGNPYNIHLCQRPLLEDLKLLFRTVGVESNLRGPYRSGSNKDGEATTSYRLDLNRRMYEQHIMGVKTRGPKFHDMFAPEFLVQEFLESGSYLERDFKDNSSYILYRRLCSGGRVSAYTLKSLCDQLGVVLKSPIYGHKTIKKIEVLPTSEETYTLSVQDSLHRFEADGVITKNSGADIMKMGLVMLYKRFWKEGWIQEEKARFMLTVHDEIVFEVKHEMLMEVMPVIEQIMTEPGRMLKWKVQLEVEPLIDAHWDPKYDYHKIMKGYIPESGKKPKATDIPVGDRYYQAPPPWLEGILVPDYMKAGLVPDDSGSTGTPLVGKSTPLEPSSKSVEAKPAVGVKPKVDSPKEPPAEPEKSVPPTRASTPPANGRSHDKETEPLKVYMRSFNLTRRSVREVAGFCTSCFDINGRVLHLVDGESGETLISPDLKVLVNPKLFEREMDIHNLGVM
jgi:DNA polymerase I-like protein with 3'-5' exonuclease and polymerase domains